MSSEMPSHDPRARRRIDWTGERAVPWAPDIQVIYEHYHRYLWARALVRGRRVLDLGCGEGFGAALLGGAADYVLGIDISQETIEHCRSNYPRPNLRFEVASATDLSPWPDASFDAIVAFEIIEHVQDQEGMLREIGRLLTTDGVLIISTPERKEYTELEGRENPFHVRELTLEEFRTLLGKHFGNVCVFGQRAMTGSRIEALDLHAQAPDAGFHLERHGDGWREGGELRPLYLLAVATRAELPELARGSVLSDFGLELPRAAERAAAEAAGEISALRAEADRRSEELAALRSEAERRPEELVTLRSEADRQSREAKRARSEVASMQRSIGWRLQSRVYRLLGGTDSLIVRNIRRLLRFGEHVAARRALRPTTFPVCRDPVATIVIPVHTGLDITARCLRAILENTKNISYEVIVVDDCSDTETARLLRRCRNVRLLVNERNLGYLRSVNRGAEAARGRAIVLLNNDTEPQPDWLIALVRRAEADADIGIVLPKLIFPTGILQEAGSIVWQDGNAWNYGCGDDPELPAYNYVREVDYGSAAALLIKADVWREIGGFDERYVPAYYEDADLCFAARALGRRVVYEPRACVMHARGASMGTDVTFGLKRHMAINRHKFAQKWAKELARQPATPPSTPLVSAADRSTEPRALVFDHTVPTHNQDAGSLRMYHLVRNLRSLGMRVTFVPENFARDEPYTSDLQALGIEVLYGDIDLPGHLRDRAAETSVVILSRPGVASRFLPVVRDCVPDARLVYDTVDLHHVREMRRAELERSIDPEEVAAMRELEHSLAVACDVTLTVSQDERLSLQEDIPGVEVSVVPLANDILAEVPPRADRAGLLFVGNFHHTPNVDAASYLVRQVMPLVWREEPEVSLTIVGGFAPAEVRELAGPNVTLTGWVEEVEPLLANFVALVAPLRYGAGVKGKVTQALAAGLPVVTTPVGCEGLPCTPGKDILVGKTEREFASLAVNVLRDDKLWLKLSRSGQALARNSCSPDVQREALRALLLNLDASFAPKSNGTQDVASSSEAALAGRGAFGTDRSSS
jgi:O-antigen biosynthesis protein